MSSTTQLHACAAPGCTRKIGHTFLMCRPHWNLVPKSLQLSVYRTWHAFQNPTHRNFLLARRDAYNKAVQAAIESLDTGLLDEPTTIATTGKDVA
jgi:hypothetical protein